MEKKEDLEFQKKTEEIRTWIGSYYITKGFEGLSKASFFSQRLLMITTFIILLIASFWVLIVVIARIKGYLYWLSWGFAMVIIWITFFISRRKYNTYWDSEVSTGKQLTKKFQKATEELSSLTYNEYQEILRLMNLSKSASVEAFKQELKDALQFENLRRWSFIKNLCQDFEVKGKF